MARTKGDRIPQGSVIPAKPHSRSLDRTPLRSRAKRARDAEGGAKVVAINPKLPADRMILEGVDTTTLVYSVSEVAKIFFAATPAWVRWAEASGKFTFDNELIKPDRTDIGPNRRGARVYTLGMIERMAHALAQGGHIDVPRLQAILSVVQAEAHLWGFIE